MLYFENFDKDFGTLGIEVAKIGLRIRTRHPRNRLYANFGKFSCIISLKNNQLACVFVTLYHKLKPNLSPIGPVGSLDFRSLVYLLLFEALFSSNNQNLGAVIH